MTTKKSMAPRRMDLTKMPKAKARVMVAKGVLAELAAKRFSPMEGIYVGSSTGLIIRPEDRKKKKNLSQCLARVKNCQACAVGGMFIAMVKIHDRMRCTSLRQTHAHRYLTMGGRIRARWARSGSRLRVNPVYLEKVFDRDQLFEIEHAFEVSVWAGRVPESPAEQFGSKYSTARARMKAIMKNVIENDGEFVP